MAGTTKKTAVERLKEAAAAKGVIVREKPAKAGTGTATFLGKKFEKPT